MNYLFILAVFSIAPIDQPSNRSLQNEKCCKPLTEKRMVGTWMRSWTNDPERPGDKFEFNRDGTFRSWNSDGRLFDHKWQGHWAIIKNKLYLIYNDQTYRRYLPEDKQRLVRVDTKFTFRKIKASEMESSHSDDYSK